MVVELAIGVIGPGLVGRTLLSQICKQVGARLPSTRILTAVTEELIVASQLIFAIPWEQASKLEEYGTLLKVVGIANSRHMLLGASGTSLCLANWQQDLLEKARFLCSLFGVNARQI